MNDRKITLSTLWVFLSVNYIFCDVLSIMEPSFFKILMTGGLQLNQGMLLGFAILVEIPFAMIVLSRVLNYRANRRANIIAGAIMALVQLLSLHATLHYLFYSAIEIGCNSFIVWFAWKWPEPAENPDSKSSSDAKL